jgi:hypothetical protein
MTEQLPVPVVVDKPSIEILSTDFLAFEQI